MSIKSPPNLDDIKPLNSSEEEPAIEDKNKDEDELEKTSWIAPEFDSMELCAKLSRELNGSGTQLDQYNLYLDPQSALDWEAVSSNESYITAQNDIPLDRAIVLIQEEIEAKKYLDQNSLDIIALGPGSARIEVSLVKKLLRDTKISKIRLYLVDISQPLLASAGKYARRMLRSEKNVKITECYADFYNLHQYSKLVNISRKAQRMALVTMFGYTFGNLKNELSFLKTNLMHFSKDTLLLMDVGIAATTADDDEQIRKKEPWLNGELKWQDAIQRWVLGPIRRYRHDIKATDEIKFTAQLDDSRRVIPGSYCVEILATLPDGVTFSVLYTKRYTPNLLIRTMGANSWTSVDGWPFGNNTILFLFRKEE